MQDLARPVRAIFFATLGHVCCKQTEAQSDGAISDDGSERAEWSFLDVQAQPTQRSHVAPPLQFPTFV